MKKAILFFILALVLTVSVAVPVSGYSTPYVNSDSESCEDAVYFCVDDTTGFVYSETSVGSERIYYTDYRACQVAVLSGRIYVSSGNELHIIDRKTSEDNTVISSDGVISRFAVTGNSIYYLESGNIYLYNRISGKTHPVFSAGNIISLWLEDSTNLSYMTDETEIRTYNLVSGEESVSPNISSELDDTIYIKENSGNPDSPDTITLSSLRSKFPSGKYWNHVSSSYNNPDGYTSSPCTHHGSGCSYSGSCGCNSFSSAIQCMGYAYKCGYDITGYVPSSGSGGWYSSTMSSSLNSVKAGDVIRYRNDGHSIFVTGVSGDTITFTDCNYNGRCGIRWDATVSKSTVRSSFTKIYISPFDCGSYTLTLDPNGGTVSKTSIPVTNGGKVGELPTPERTGYYFDGWFTSPTGGEQIVSSSVVNLNSYSTLYAHWTIITYTVNFDANGGTGTLPKSFTKTYGESVTMGTAKPTRKGYTFTGWNTRADGAGTGYKSGGKYDANDSATLFAQWEANQYLVSFNANGGTVSPANRKYTYDSPYGELPVPEKTGYRFTGWYTSSTGSTRIEETTIVSITSTTTFYAHWEIQTYRIVYDANGGSNAPAEQEKTYGKFIILSSSVPRRTGFIFKNWNTSPLGYGKTYNGGDFYNTDEDVTLYAQWEREKYLVEFYSNGGRGAPENAYKEYGIDMKITSEAPVRDGYTFTGWNTASSGNGTHYSAGDKYTLNQPVILYAEWQANEYTLRFYANGGINTVDRKTVVFDSVYGELPVPEKPGHTFEGWFTGKTDGVMIKSDDKVDILSDISLYAHWRINTYNIAYSANGGENAPRNQTKIYGTDIVLDSAVPVNEGYTFVSWNTRAGGNGENYRPGSVYSANADTTLYAVWKTTEYTVVLDSNGGQGGVQSIKVPYAGESVLPEETPSRNGFSFKEWNSDMSGNGNSCHPGDTVTADEDTVLYAVWNPVQIQAVLDTGGGVCSEDTITLTYGDVYGELPVPGKDGYIFTGWYTDEQFSCRVYGSSVCDRTEQFTLYAGWKQKKFIVNLNANGGTVSPASLSLGYGDTFEILPVPSRTGCEFDGWYTQEGQKISADMTVQEDTCLVANWLFDTVQAGETEYTVKWVYGDGYTEKTYNEGEAIEVYTPQTEHGYVFCGWDSEVPATMPDSNLVFNAVFESDLFEIEFIASGKTVEKIYYTADSREIDEPDVPVKEGYTGKWPGYVLGERYTPVIAEYTPEVYKAKFFANEILSGTADYTVETQYISEPAIPQKNGYSAEWEDYSLTAGGISVNAVYTADTYTAYFILDRKTIGTVSYDINTERIDEPEIPYKPGYSTYWREYELAAGETYIYGCYEPVVYLGRFVAGDTVLGEFEYTVETVSTDEPDVPAIAGYTGHWKEYSFNPGGITVNAVYVPNKYTITFTADGVTVSSIVFTYGDESVAVPDVPAKEGYTGSWPEFILTCEDITCQAVYVPTVYKIRFVADGLLVEEKEFTVVSTYVKAPEIPAKEGYTAHWENYTVGPYDITVNAVYVTETYIRIAGYVNVLKVDYMSTVVFYYDAGGLEEGQYVNWIVNGTTYGVGREDGSIEIKEIKDSFKIKAVIVDSSGTVKESESELITVNKSFFVKFRAFFLKLFGRLPVIVQK